MCQCEIKHPSKPAYFRKCVCERAAKHLRCEKVRLINISMRARDFYRATASSSVSSSRSQTVLRRLQKSLTLSIHLRLRGLTLSSKHSKLPFPRELPTPQIHSLKVDSGCSSQSGEKKKPPTYCRSLHHVNMQLKLSWKHLNADFWASSYVVFL